MSLRNLKRFMVLAASGTMLFQTTGGCLTAEQAGALEGLGRMALAVYVSIILGR